jgi:hypothetical protein
LQMIVMLLRTYHVDGLIAALKTVLYERKQHAVLFVGAVKKRTDVTYVTQLGTGKGNWRHGLPHGVNLALLWIVWEMRFADACLHLGRRGKGASYRHPS